MKDIEIQEQMTKEIERMIEKIDTITPPLKGYYHHAHKCTFKMLYPEIAKEECAKWRAQHPIIFPNKWHPPTCLDDYCDFCDMMNYISLDNEGRIQYVIRSNPAKLLSFFNKRNKT